MSSFFNHKGHEGDCTRDTRRDVLIFILTTRARRHKARRHVLCPRALGVYRKEGITHSVLRENPLCPLWLKKRTSRFVPSCPLWLKNEDVVLCAFVSIVVKKTLRKHTRKSHLDSQRRSSTNARRLFESHFYTGSKSSTVCK